MTPLTVIPEKVAVALATDKRGAWNMTPADVALAALNADRTAESERVKGLVEALERTQIVFGQIRQGYVMPSGVIQQMIDEASAALSAYTKGEKL